jgi:hypothetical protein
MKVKTSIKAGGAILQNHNESLARTKAAPKARAPGLKVRTGVKAGGALLPNHNESLARAHGRKARLR